jgi:hypothetical protein
MDIGFKLDSPEKNTLQDDVDKLTKSVDKLRLDLAELGCSIKGNKQTLQKRLKQAKKSRNISTNNNLSNPQGKNDLEPDSNDSKREDAGYVTNFDSIIVDSGRSSDVSDCLLFVAYIKAFQISLLITICSLT